MTAPPSSESALGEREAQILRAIVEDYIRSGEPVGSQTVAPRCEVSAATVRSVMADLESQGLLEKPHTSAGRKPTDQGYRYYVDALLTVREPDPGEQRLIERGCAVPAGIESRLQEASRLLHSLSRHAGVVATPRPSPSRLRQIDLLRLGDGRVLAVVVTQEGIVLNKLLEVDFTVSAAELSRATRTLNGLLAEHTAEEVRERITRELELEKGAYDLLLERALALVQTVVAGAAAPELLLSGQASLLEAPDLDLARIRSLFAALEEKQRLLAIFEQTARGGSMQIFIGAESPLGQDAGVAVVTAPYGAHGQILGAVGVIGPTRMDYGRVIPLVDFTARTVTQVLSEH
ncbi:MAG: heat-inducible transcriptional repressor HrcA [Myxococcales bacterium]